MEMIILEIDHELQCHDPRLKEVIAELVERRVAMIAEENRALFNTLGRQVSELMNLLWIQIDMSIEDRIKARISEKLSNRMQIRGYDEFGESHTSDPLCPSRGRDQGGILAGQNRGDLDGRNSAGRLRMLALRTIFGKGREAGSQDRVEAFSPRESVRPEGGILVTCTAHSVEVSIPVPTETKYEKQRAITALRSVADFLESKLDAAEVSPCDLLPSP